MNIYIATNKNTVGMVLTGNHNKIYLFKTFETRTTDAESQVILATQRAVSFVKANKVMYAGNEINLYTDNAFEPTMLNENEYLSRFGYPVEFREPVTAEEKSRMLLARTEVEMEVRKKMMRGVNDGRR